MTDSVHYEVVREYGRVEIRRYPPITLATVSAASDNEAFSILFDYISGNNEPSERIAMTAPVISRKQGGERLAMTAPVISATGSFSFVLPSSYNAGSAPRPRSRSIRLEDIPSRLVAVIGFAGRAKDRDLEEEERELVETMGKNGLKAIGGPFLMRYNSPFTPGFMRHNELGYEIEDAGSIPK